MKRARWFLETMVKPAFAEWERDLGSEMRMRCVIGFANDMAEWVWHDIPVNLRPKSAGELRKQFRAKSRFGLVADIANGTKHVALQRGNPDVSKADQVRQHSYLTFDEVESVDALDDFDSLSFWVVEDDRGGHHPIRPIVEECIDMWEAVVKQHGG